MLFESDGRPRGHLALKSSTLCPNGGKLTSQYLIVDHLVAHYKKLKNVKSQVDTSPPKAWLASQKVRDRIMRDALKDDVLKREWFMADRTNVRSSSVRTSEFDRSDMVARMQGMKLHNDDVDGMAMSAHRNKHPQDGHAATYRQHSETVKLENTGKSRGSGRDYGDDLKSKLQSQIFEATRFASESDLIESRKHMFTEGKPFTPRTLKTNMSSKLAKQGYYNPPKRKSKNPREKVRILENTLDENTTKSLGDTTGLNDTLLTDTMRSYDVRAHSAPSGVPLLNISLDTDNLRWLKEQSRISEAKQVQVQLTASEPSVVPEEVRRQNVSVAGPQNQSALQQGHVSARDEELMYLNFIKDVTKDILDRGIYTNRALKQVFESHVAKHKDELKLSKMQDMIKDLRSNLGIPEFDDPEDEGFGFTSSKEIAKSDISPARNLESNDSLLMTRQTFDLKQLRSGRRGSRGLNLNSRTALHDVLEVQEEDLSAESGRSGALRKKEARAGERSDDDDTSMAIDTLRSEGVSTLGFDEIDSYLGKTQLIYRDTSSDQKKLSPKSGHLQSESLEKGDYKKLGVGLEKQKEKEERKASEGVPARESSARRKRRTPEHIPGKPFDQRSRSSTPFSTPDHMASHSPAGTDRSLELQVVTYEDGHQPDIQMVETKLKDTVHGINSHAANLDNAELRIESPAPKTNSPVPKLRSSQLKAKTPEPNHNDKPLHVEHVSFYPSELAGSSVPAVNTISEKRLSPPVSPQMRHDNQVDGKAREEEDGGETSRTVGGNDGMDFDDDSSELLDTLGEYKHSLEITDNYDDDDYEEDEEDTDEKRTGVERSPRPLKPLSQMEQINDDF